jgi:hypothetical protein
MKKIITATQHKRTYYGICHNCETSFLFQDEDKFDAKFVPPDYPGAEFWAFYVGCPKCQRAAVSSFRATAKNKDGTPVFEHAEGIGYVDLSYHNLTMKKAMLLWEGRTTWPHDEEDLR